MVNQENFIKLMETPMPASQMIEQLIKLAAEERQSRMGPDSQEPEAVAIRAAKEAYTKSAMLAAASMMIEKIKNDTLLPEPQQESFNPNLN